MRNRRLTILLAANGLLALASCTGDDLPPLVAHDISIQIDEDALATGRVTVEGASGQALTFGIQQSAASGRFDIDPASGELTYQPDPDFHGQDIFSYSVSDGSRRRTFAKVSITILPVPDAPRIEPVPDLENSSTERIRKWPLRVVDPEGDPITVRVATENASVGTVRHNPITGDLEIEPLALGDTTISVEASDGALQSTDSFVFHVRRVVRTERLNGLDPSSDAITVTNTFAERLDVGLSWNDRTIYESREDMATAAMLSAGTDPQSRALALWRFVKANVYHGQPLADDLWEHDPLLLLNSIGWGFCDDLASALAHLARTSGFEARVWALNGHVVPEINVQGSWKLLDPDLAVFYRNDRGDIASVEEVQARPDLITNPLSPLADPSTTYGYQPFIADIYASSSDNLVWPWYDGGATEVKGTFELPPGGQLKFPALWVESILDSADATPVAYATLKLIVPSGFTGFVRFPLVTRAIEGRGRVRLRGKIYDVGSPALDEFIGLHQLFIPGVEVVAAEEPIEFVMLVNPSGASLRDDNEVRFKALHAWALDVVAEPLPATVRPAQETTIPAFPFDWDP